MILTTFPGRYGDLLWSLPAIRAVAQANGGQVDLQIAGEFASLLPVLQEQAYLRYVWAEPTWSMTPPEEWRAPITEGKAERYDRVIHCGYRGWPEHALPQHVCLGVKASYPSLEIAPLDLTTLWIDHMQTPTAWFAGSPKIAVGFTECHFELKYGLFWLLRDHWHGWDVKACMGGGRWANEARETFRSWREAAGTVAQCDLFLGDCSALHVLAVAMGKRVVIVEPMEARWNPIFYPYGMDGPQVTVVQGLDGRPTFDARHVVETLEAQWATKS